MTEQVRGFCPKDPKELILKSENSLLDLYSYRTAGLAFINLSELLTHEAIDYLSELLVNKCQQIIESKAELLKEDAVSFKLLVEEHKHHYAQLVIIHRNLRRGNVSTLKQVIDGTYVKMCEFMRDFVMPSIKDCGRSPSELIPPYPHEQNKYLYMNFLDTCEFGDSGLAYDNLKILLTPEAEESMRLNAVAHCRFWIDFVIKEYFPDCTVEHVCRAIFRHFKKRTRYCRLEKLTHGELMAAVILLEHGWLDIRAEDPKPKPKEPRRWGDYNVFE